MWHIPPFPQPSSLGCLASDIDEMVEKVTSLTGKIHERTGFFLSRFRKRGQYYVDVYLERVHSRKFTLS